MLEESVTRRSFIGKTALSGLALGAAAPAFLAACAAGGNTPAKSGSVRSFSFAYAEPHTTVGGFIADTFAQKLQELSNGSLQLVQYGNGTLGQEQDTDLKILSGDIDFALSATANLTVVAPEAGVLSLHYLFKDQNHMVKSMSDPKVNQVFSQMVADKTQGAMSLGLFTSGFRDVYAKRAINSIADLKGVKMRVQASKTEDAFFNAYGAVAVHMPLGQVYTSLQTGVIDMAETTPDGFVQFKFYEVTPVMSATEHEVDNFHLGMSKKTWDSLTKQQQTWVKDAFAYMQPLAIQKAMQLAGDAVGRINGVGAKFNSSFDKSGLEKIAVPLQDTLATSLGSTATELLSLIRKLG
jgi:TRAP-type transport system periplasmic protein